MNNLKIQTNKKIHFIGIGGIGMSGLAQVMKSMGFYVQGSDISNSKNVERCKRLGIKIFNRHRVSNIRKVDIVVRSSAIKNNNPEIIAAKQKK